MLQPLFLCIVFIVFALPSTLKPLDLGSLRVINSTRDLNDDPRFMSHTNTTDSVEDLLGCFQQYRLPEPQLARTSFKDCYNAEQQLAAYDPHVPIHFHRNNDTSFEIPVRFTYRTCVIFLDMIYADAEDVFYVEMIRNAVIDTARRCTARPKALGGMALVGPRKLMGIWVTGRP